MFTTSAPRITVRFVALLTAVSLVLSAFPAAFFVANAQEVPPEVPANETPVEDAAEDTEETPAVPEALQEARVAQPTEGSATIIATKIICDDESDLPNWGSTTDNADITADTAEDWVDAHEGCYFAKGWQFQWAPLSSEISNPGDTLVGEAGEPWTTFSYSATIPQSAFAQGVWVREVLQDGYIPFTYNPGKENTNDVSAEIYCNADVLNYDNFDYVGGLEDDATYYCVAWNVPLEVQEVPECEIGNNLISNGSFENPTIDNDFGWEVFPSGTSGLGWTISWLTGAAFAPNPALLELQNSSVAHTAFVGSQYAELDSNWNGAPGGTYSGEDARVKIEQTIATTPGATYRLAYAFSALPDTGSDNNILKVGVDGVEVATQVKDGSANSDTDWSVFTNEFVADDTSTTISFADQGISDTFGTLLDGVSVCKTKDPVIDEPETYTIDGYKFNDTDADGVWDESEPAISGWEINLWNGEVKIATTSTNIDGYYSFTVKAGNYQVTETQRENWVQTATLGEADGDICYFNFDEELSFSKVLDDENQNQFEGQCVFGNHQNEVVEEEPEEPTRKGSSGTRTKRAPQGQVLGATTQCGLWLEDYMQKATLNDTYQVLKLQVFLTLQGYATPLTGIFDVTTEANVKLFQAKYADTVIKPWFEKGIVPHNRPTGFVYKTTRWQINDIMCPGIEAYPSFDGENLTTNVLVR